jgi:hypothetical protein
MKYEDIGKEMLKDIEYDDDLIQKYNLEQFTTLDLNCSCDLILVLNAICKTKDDPNNRNQEKSSTGRVNKLINNVLNINM